MKKIGTWKYIDPVKLAQRIKSLPLGSDKPFEQGPVVGLGSTPKDTNWRRRVIQAISPTAHPTAEEAEVELQSLLAAQQLEEAKELVNYDN